MVPKKPHATSRTGANSEVAVCRRAAASRLSTDDDEHTRTHRVRIFGTNKIR